MTRIDHGIFDLVINDDVACMDFNPSGTRYPQDLVTSSFEREKRYVLKLIKYAWAPELLEVNPHTRQIVFKWYGNTCEEYVPNNYKEQLEQITKDLYKEQIYKPSFYTKYFYTDNSNQMHAYAFYSSSDISEQPISMDFYRPILNEQRSKLVDQLEINGMLDMGILVKHAFTDYIKWPDDPLPEIYRKVYQC
ncbi:MAG: hypothetical protein RLZZ196_3456 [Bacteroidota bacterium]